MAARWWVRRRRSSGTVVVAAVLWALCCCVPGSCGVCPSGCSCDDDNLVVTCMDANLDVIPITLNPSIQRLVLQKNRIKTVDAAFQFYGELLHVDLSRNHLVSVVPKSFEAQKKLVELHLDHNKVSNLENTTFSGLRSLTVLSLRGNYLQELGPRLFSYLQHLQELDLGANSIERVDPSAFSVLEELRVLYLDDNNLKSIPTSALAAVPNLAELHVGFNEFNFLGDRAFGTLPKLATLDLSGAKLANISALAFQGVESVRQLHLVENDLREIPTRALSKLSRLEEVYLGQNLFTTIPSQAFLGLDHLRLLDVTGARFLLVLDKDCLASNLDLEVLVLSSNKKLSGLPDGMLTGLPNLRHLSLRDNAFSEISSGLAAWSEVKSLDLRDNPLRCSCSLLWLRDLLVQKNMSQATCLAPLELKGRTLQSLSSEELSCALHHSQQQAIIGVVCAASAGLLALLAFLLFRYRKRVRNVFKDYKWNNHSLGGKEHEYQKTLGDEDYIVRAAYNQQQTLKPIPVTEL